MNMSVKKIPSPRDNSEVVRTITALSLGVTKSRTEPARKEERLEMPPQIPDLRAFTVHFCQTVFTEPTCLPKAGPF